MTEVGKDFIVEGIKSDRNRKLYDFLFLKLLEKIGENICIKDNLLLNSFFGLEDLRHIGAKNITIKVDVELKNADDGTKLGF